GIRLTTSGPLQVNDLFRNIRGFPRVRRTDCDLHRLVKNQAAALLVAHVTSRLKGQTPKVEICSSAGNIRGLADPGKSHAQDVAPGALVFVQRDPARLRKAVLKLFKGSAGGAAKAIDGLIGVAHGKNVFLVSAYEVRQDDVAGIAVLKFVHQDKPRASAF